MSDVTVDGTAAKRGLEMLRAGFYQASAQALRAVIETTTADARTTTLFKDQTGETRASITGEVTEPGRRGFVRAGGAAKFLENGTPPHLIPSNGPGFLRFVVNGTLVQGVMQVHHPGTTERPFMRQARDRAEMVAAYAFEEFISYAIRAS